MSYFVLSFIGRIIPAKSPITFGLLVWVSMPLFMLMFILGAWRYYTLGTAMDLALVGAWVFLLLTMTAYWLCDKLDITPKPWAKDKGIWFSQNDTLHFGLILWMIYNPMMTVAEYVQDDLGAA